MNRRERRKMKRIRRAMRKADARIDRGIADLRKVVRGEMSIEDYNATHPHYAIEDES